MKELTCDAVVIGAGAAGMAAASSLAEAGHSVVVVEREGLPGGILNQCIHNGFGLHFFDEELTGPEYAERFLERISGHDKIDLYTDATVMDIAVTEGSAEESADHSVFAYSPSDGLLRFDAKVVVLAMGCRERNRGNIGIPGTRPAGIFTAGLAQRLVNIEGYVPGERVVIVGSGDIGLIMARRMTWIGATVLGVVEIQPYPSGLTRNIVQCLNDFGIPLYLSHVVTDVIGKDRVESVEVSPLADGRPDTNGRFILECDTLLLSVGLIPDNELSKKAGVSINPETGGPSVDASLMTNVPGIFACGNVLHVHDLVDYASEEAERCGQHASEYIRGGRPERTIDMVSGPNVRYVVPQSVHVGSANTVYARSMIVKNNARLVVTSGDLELTNKPLRHVQPSEMLQFELSPDAEVREAITVRIE